MAEPTPAGFADKIKGATNSLGFLAYLFDPNQPSFDNYSGEYPEGLSKNLSGLMDMANMLGMGGNIADMIDMNKIADTLTEAHVLKILDNLNDPEKFAEVYKNASMKAIIAQIAGPLIADGMDALTLEDGLKTAGLAQIDLSNFKDGDTPLSGIKIGDLNEETIAAHISALSNDDTLAFLNSLPDAQKNDFLTKLATVEGDDGSSTPLTDENGETVTFADMSIEDAITKRAEIGLATSWTGTFNNLTGSNLGADAAVNSVYDGIRDGLPASFMQIINDQKDSQAMPEDPTALFTELRKQLADRTNGGRAEIINLISDNMATIREELKKAENVAFLVQFMPDDLQTGAMAQGLRDFLQDNGFLQPIISALQSFLPFISQMLRGFGLDGVAEKLEGALDVTTMQQDGLTREANVAAAGVEQPAVVAPTPETVQPDPATIQPSGN